MLTKTELKRLGFTDVLIVKLLGAPDKIEFRKRGVFRFEAHMYADHRVEAAKASPEFLAAADRRQARKRVQSDRFSEFAKRYPSWRRALPEACAAMFSLNRYAKHASCAKASQAEIYDLKNRLLRILYEDGYCVECWEHVARFPEKQCWDCGGDGCDRCGYSGVYREGRTVHFFCFRFQVSGKAYTWHQPAELVDYPIRTTAPPAEWEGVVPIKPVPVSATTFAAAKDLLRWVIGAAASDAVSPPAEVEIKHWIAPTEIEGRQMCLFTM